MCGRYTLSAGHEALARAFLAEFAAELKTAWRERYNITPGTGIVVVLEDRDRGGRRAEILHWGLVPHWASDPDIGRKLTNARAETIAGKPAYRDAFRYRRCLIPATGFYEWDRSGPGTPQPWYFYPAEGPFMAMAGIWDHWLHPSGSEILSVSIVTRPAIGAVAAIHHRMPVILPPSAWASWLDTGNVKPEMAAFNEASAGDAYLDAHRVSPWVNASTAEGPGLIEPLILPPGKGSPTQLDLFS